VKRFGFLSGFFVLWGGAKKNTVCFWPHTNQTGEMGVVGGVPFPFLWEFFFFLGGKTVVFPRGLSFFFETHPNFFKPPGTPPRGKKQKKTKKHQPKPTILGVCFVGAGICFSKTLGLVLLFVFRVGTQGGGHWVWVVFWWGGVTPGVWFTIKIFFFLNFGGPFFCLGPPSPPTPPGVGGVGGGPSGVGFKKLFSPVNRAVWGRFFCWKLLVVFFHETLVNQFFKGFFFFFFCNSPQVWLYNKKTPTNPNFNLLSFFFLLISCFFYLFFGVVGGDVF